MTVLFITALCVLLVLLGLIGLFICDRRSERAEWQRLAALQPAHPPRFSPEMVAHLPEPAQRYFNFTIMPGASLRPVAVIDMIGRFSAGTKNDPAYRPMQARQILAAPEGFVWTMRTRAGIPVSGSDCACWTRFGIFGLIPVARRGDTPDHRRAAFARYVAEAVFWTPAALLPGAGVRWERGDADMARVTVRHGALEQSVDVAVDHEGRPLRISFMRWSDANPEKRYRLQPFGGHMSDFREVAGYRLPFRVEAGNMFGTEDYFPFFCAEVTAIRFPQHSG